MPKPNGFAQFINEQRRSNPRLKDKSFDEISVAVDHLWKAMSPEEKSEYQVRAKGPRIVNKVNNNSAPAPDREAVLGGFDAMGRSLLEIERRKQNYENEKIEKIDSVKEMVENGKKRETLADDTFFIIHVNIFVRTPDTNVVVPAEVALTKFSFKSGMLGSYQAFIQPGNIPPGYKYKCIERSQLKHKIPIYAEVTDSGLNGNNCNELKRPDDGQIVTDLKKFLDGAKNVFTLGEEMTEDCQDVLDTLCKRAGMKTMGLKLLPLASLMFHLVDGIPHLSVAESEFEKERYLYEKDLSCAWHESETDSQHCSEAYVKRWMYTLLAFTNDQFNVRPVDDGRHAPKGSLTVTIYSSDNDEADWGDIEETNELRIYPHDKNSIFASSDIRYRDVMEDNGSQSIFTTTDLMSSAAVSNAGSEVELEPCQDAHCQSSPAMTPAGSQVSLVSMVSSASETRRGTLLQNIRNQRTSSRMVAKF